MTEDFLHQPEIFYTVKGRILSLIGENVITYEGENTITLTEEYYHLWGRMLSPSGLKSPYFIGFSAEAKVTK